MCVSSWLKGCGACDRCPSFVMRSDSFCYGKDMVMCERMQGIMVSAMGEQMYTVRLKTFDEMTEFDRFVHERES